MSSNGIPAWAPEVAEALLQGVLKKDPFTFYHCCRVGRAARKMGEILELPEYEQYVLEFAGLFHDIGKIGIPDHILLKPGRLTPEEVSTMKSHSEMSVEMIRPLTNSAFFRHVVPGVRFHHERYDGQGYPMVLKGEKIPLFGRILAVVDSVDAMMNTRPYRQALGLDHVKKELVDYSGTQFDPNLARLYLEHLDRLQDQDDGVQKEIAIAHILKAA